MKAKASDLETLVPYVNQFLRDQEDAQRYESGGAPTFARRSDKPLVTLLVDQDLRATIKHAHTLAGKYPPTFSGP